MNTRNENDKMIDEILKEVQKEIEPPDTWQSLRSRIDHRIASGDLTSVSSSGIGSVTFWRRLAFSMAACFMITVGLLIYFIGFHDGVRKYQQQYATTVNNNLLNPTEINSLKLAFEQVRQLFGQQTQWIMIGSGNSTQMGIANKIPLGVENRNIIVVRLAVDYDSKGMQRRYFDVVTFSNQQVDFQLPLADASAIDVSLVPILKNDGKIAVNINAQVNGSSRAKGIATVTEEAFTSLVRMRANGSWINIDAIGQQMSSI